MPKIKSIKYIGDIEQQCISVSQKDGLYITDDDIITHNSVMQSANSLQWKQNSDAGGLLGMQILQAAMTEVSFFIDAGKGWTDEKVMLFITKLRQRIKQRFKNNYYARFIIDTSPNNLDSEVQQWITYNSKDNAENLVWEGQRWDLYPWEFPDFCNLQPDGETKVSENHNFDVGFKLFKGSKGKPPSIVENQDESVLFDDSDCIWCPRLRVTTTGSEVLINGALENPIEFMKDIAGIPASQADRLFYNNDWIERCFNNGLKNIYGCITALAQDEPEHLIWNQIQPIFFFKVIDNWRFYYAPECPRVISVDQSKSKDFTCISMTHVERDPVRKDEQTGQSILVYVTDFTIVLIPKGGAINFDAIKFFIRDLRQLGGLNILHTSFDDYQSAPTRQYLERQGFTVDYISVDKNNDPYFTFYDLVVHNRWNCGKNIFVKNNMKSIYQQRRKNTNTMKIEHFSGPISSNYTGNWELDNDAGKYAKDTTDAIAGNVYLLQLYSNEFVPNRVWDSNANFLRSYENISKKNDEFLQKRGMII